MKKNMGTIDRTIRLVLAVMVAILILTGAAAGVLAVVLGMIAAVFVVTSLIGFCPAYVPFGISTIEKDPSRRAGTNAKGG